MQQTSIYNRSFPYINLFNFLDLQNKKHLISLIENLEKITKVDICKNAKILRNN